MIGGKGQHVKSFLCFSGISGWPIPSCLTVAARTLDSRPATTRNPLVPGIAAAGFPPKVFYFLVGSASHPGLSSFGRLCHVVLLLVGSFCFQVCQGCQRYQSSAMFYLVDFNALPFYITVLSQSKVVAYNRSSVRSTPMLDIFHLQLNPKNKAAAVWTTLGRVNDPG